MKKTKRLLSAFVGVIGAYALISLVTYVAAIWNVRGEARSYHWQRICVSAAKWGETIAVSPNQSVFAGFDSATVNSDSINSIYRSDDNGKTWIPASKGIKKCWVHDIAIDSRGTVFATTGRGVYRSANNGKSWKLIFPLEKVSSSIFRVKTDGRGNLYGIAGYSCLYSLADSGNNRKKLFNDKSLGDIRVIASNSKGAIFIGSGYKGLYRSTDNGQSWKRLKAGLGAEDVVKGLVIDSKGRIYAVTDKFVIKSSDNGEHWQKHSLGHKDIACYSLAIDSKNNLILGTSGGLFISVDKGSTWLQMGAVDREFIMFKKPLIKDVAVDSHDRIYAISFRNSVFCGVPKSKR